MLLRLRSCYYYFVGNRHALLFYYKHQQHSLGNAQRRREEYIKNSCFRSAIFCDFLKNGRPIPSIGGMHVSTPMLLKLSLDNKWSTVNVSVKKFWSWHLSRVHRTYSVVCEVTESASSSTGIIGIWCSDVFFCKVKESIMIMYGCVSCNTGICRTRYYNYNLCSVRYRYFFLLKRP